ncbi:MAG TPA: hypothetical protein VGW58_13575 [Pyrinomonadaceae bacterium]|nr:hypothetical protein [Pyrinomonadaceae bacterium]
MLTLRHVVLFLFAMLSTAQSHVFAQRVKHSKEVIDAYRVCQQFQRLLAEDLDFDRAFEATFTKNQVRRREIAISEGEFGPVDLDHVDDATLIGAYKSRMQILYLMLTLASPDSNEQEQEFFPPPIKAIFKRKGPERPEDFPSFSAQLKRDVADLRAHLNRLAVQDPAVAERVRSFKSDLSRVPQLPKHKVEPLTAYSRGRVLDVKEKYYQVGDYAVIREGAQMRIIGIRFFSRLF